MTETISKEAWREIAMLLKNEGDGNNAPAVLEQVFPGTHVSISALEALQSSQVAADAQQLEVGQGLHAGLSGLLKQLAVFESISRCPILAITGMLNAGKSSLLATFLSPGNRARVLRGLGNAAGTHRFVLWLPSVWQKEPELLGTLIGFLTTVFGHPPERLSDDPREATLQYNGQILPNALLLAEDAAAEGRPLSAAVDPLSVPLIAYDEGLDRLKLGLADCPDIQTGFVSSAGLSGEALAAQRRGHLLRIGRLCSAFIVVSKLNSLHDESLLQVLSILRDAVPGVPRLLAINKVKARYTPETVYQESRGLLERFAIGSVYVAYDFRSSLAHTRVPAPPPGMVFEESEPLPIFFDAGGEVGGDAGSKDNKALHYLYELGERLDPGTLARESSRSLVMQLKAKTLEAMQWLEGNLRLRDEQVRDGWRSVSDACLDFMSERDAEGRVVGLRLQASPAIVAQLAASLQRTAPLWMGLSLKIDRTARQLQQAVANSANRFKLLQGVSDSVTQFSQRFRRGEGATVVTPARFAECIRSHDRHDALQHLPPAALESGCAEALARFAAEDRTQLNEQELDAWSKQIWEGMSFRDKLWKGTQPLAVVLAPLLAAVLIPIDAGGTAVLVFASTKELLAAAGIAALSTPFVTGKETLSIVQRETPWRQLGDLFAITCDSIGLPRPAAADLPESQCAGQPRKLAQSGLPVKLTQQPAQYVWRLNLETLNRLHLSIRGLTFTP
jgi:hypothetical protein